MTADTGTSRPPALEQMAAFACGLRIAGLPHDVVAKVKDCVIDALSACLTVGARAEGNCALALARTRPGNGESTIFGTANRASAADAAFVNAVTAFGTSRSDTHPVTASHPGSVVIPAVLALAEARRISGEVGIAAIVAGYETMLRLGNALITPEFAKIFRPTAMIAPTGAAIAVGRLIGLDAAGLVNAASLATQTAFGLNEWSNAGTSELAYHSGFAARNAVDCALLAEAGAVAAPGALDGKTGLLAGFGALARSERLAERLGSDYKILEIAHKPAPACIYVQAPCQVAQALTRGSTLRGRAIQSVDIHVTEAAAAYPGCDDPGPIGSMQAAKMSIQFAVAAVLLRGGIADKCWQEFDDPTVNALAARCRVKVDTDLTAASPKTGCRIEVKLTTGQSLSSEQDDVVSMSSIDLIDRFLLAARPKIGDAASQEILRFIDMMERMEDLSVLNRALASMQPQSLLQ